MQLYGKLVALRRLERECFSSHGVHSPPLTCATRMAVWHRPTVVQKKSRRPGSTKPLSSPPTELGWEGPFSTNKHQIGPASSGQAASNQRHNCNTVSCGFRGAGRAQLILPCREPKTERDMARAKKACSAVHGSIIRQRHGFATGKSIRVVLAVPVLSTTTFAGFDVALWLATLAAWRPQQPG